MKNLTGKDKYILSLKDELTLVEIMNLNDCGRPKAQIIREKAIDYCIKNDIEIGEKKIPSNAVYFVTNKSINYYWEKYTLERRVYEYEEA